MQSCDFWHKVALYDQFQEEIFIHQKINRSFSNFLEYTDRIQKITKKALET